MMTEILLAAMFWGVCNRTWGESDELDGISKVASALILSFGTCIILLRMNYDLWNIGLEFVIIGAGFWLGRVTDGVRGTFLQKALRGWKYSPIYFLTAWCLGNYWAIAPVLFFWQSGLIHWSMYRISRQKWDYVPTAELIDGAVRGALFIAAMEYGQ